jgi:hypothetical protein
MWRIVECFDQPAGTLQSLCELRDSLRRIDKRLGRAGNQRFNVLERFSQFEIQWITFGA